ncbi:MAG: hypothetical protein BZY87_02940 [SAR202 cluster bacterium Io17-Chloro-G6]|nr:MAG: hypothetical protein BZY87_02940 [SAR202 cluster bacterium Io17-Chloro-G6]
MAIRTVPSFEDRAVNILLDGGFITQDQLNHAKTTSDKESSSLLVAIVLRRMVDQETLITVLKVQLGIPAVDLRSVDVDPEAVALFPEKDARRHCVMPVGFESDGSLRIATLMPDDSKLSSTLSTLTGFPTTLELAIGGDLEDMIDRVFAANRDETAKVAQADEDDAPEAITLSEDDGPEAISPPENDASEANSLSDDDPPEAISPPEDDPPEAISPPEDDSSEVISSAEDAAPEASSRSNGGGAGIFLGQDLNNLPAMKIVDLLTLQAVESSASDIHLVPGSDSAKVLFRMNGALQMMVELPLPLHENMVATIKVEAGMAMSEDPSPRDGGFSLNVGERRVEFRVTSMSTTWGEMMVIRVIDQFGGFLSLESLGMDSQSLEIWRTLLESPHGMLMVSGPAGSGKTTTLYASLAELIASRGNVMSVEDPIEYRINGVNQIQVNHAAGMDFPSAMNSILRLDPDVILVGEIGDPDTATAAINAALTGHLVLASIDGSDAASSIVRLLDLGLEPVLAATGVIGCLAQRLVRQVCPQCGTATEATRTEAIAYEQEIGQRVTQFMSGPGCDFCNDSGFVGQGGVMEVLSVDEDIRSQISQRASGAEFRETAIGNGMVGMRRAGLLMAQSGKTTISEVLRKAFILG